MDDNTATEAPPIIYKIPVKGTTYDFHELPTEETSRLVLVLDMAPSPHTIAKALFTTLAKAAGDGVWDQITERFVAQDIDLDDVTDIFRRLTQRMAKSAKARKTSGAQ